jgi:hypothetical protein
LCDVEWLLPRMCPIQKETVQHSGENAKIATSRYGFDSSGVDAQNLLTDGGSCVRRANNIGRLSLTLIGQGAFGQHEDGCLERQLHRRKIQRDG